MTPQLSIIAVVFDVSHASITLIRQHFTTVHYYPDGDVPAEIVPTIQVWFCNWLGLPQWIGPEMLKETKIVQLTSGASSLFPVKVLRVSGLGDELWSFEV